MTATLTITLDDAVIAALRESRTINITLAADGQAPAKAKAAKGRAAGGTRPREGSLPARVLDWAAKRGKPFGNKDVEKRFKLSRGHASMVTSTLANGPHPIKRVKRGVYQHAG